ncbi:glycosyltransferase family 39 protein [Marinilongibacter aquaticus]|uniref:glycosyltransferase family 39 protein n=1 Tax=Marinilongibacter aquaticus TaxID=2975157 RepID=UPI0021BD6E4A|nr:glycosyltransferase family 39 protein [Marinilongibacter aquaticus]UBM60583.1 glycosyltransferase family 39 protein [Marinilongibacter aquaticus]
MPGYPLFIRICDRVFGASHLFDVIVSIQILFSLLSVWALYRLSERLLGEKWAFLAALLYALCPYPTFYDLRILTESLTLSFLIFSLYFAFGSPLKSINFNCLLASLCLTICISLKPIGFVAMIWLIVFYLLKKWSVKEKAIALSCLLSCFVLFELCWMPFNYKRYGEIVPFTRTPLYSWYYDNFVTHASELTATFGALGKEDYLLNPEVGTVPLHLPYLGDVELVLPYQMDDVFTDEYNLESVQALQKELENCQTCFGKNKNNRALWEQEADKRAAIFGRVKAMQKSIQREHPFIAYFGSKLLPIGLFLGQDVRRAHYRQEEKFYYYKPHNIGEKILRHVWNTSYVFVLLFGVLGTLWVWPKAGVELKIMALLGQSLLFIYPVVYSFSEWRYIVTALPCLCIFAAFSLKKMTIRFKRKAS